MPIEFLKVFIQLIFSNPKLLVGTTEGLSINTCNSQSKEPKIDFCKILLDFWKSSAFLTFRERTCYFQLLQSSGDILKHSNTYLFAMIHRKTNKSHLFQVCLIFHENAGIALKRFYWYVSEKNKNVTFLGDKICMF